MYLSFWRYHDSSCRGPTLKLVHTLRIRNDYQNIVNDVCCHPRNRSNQAAKVNRRTIQRKYFIRTMREFPYIHTFMQQKSLHNAASGPNHLLFLSREITMRKALLILRTRSFYCFSFIQGRIPIYGSAHIKIY